MNPIRRLLLALLAALPVASLAAPQAGSDYTILQPQPTEAPGKIVVTEFFWYGCPHCFDFEPALEAWLKKQKPDVKFRLVPAILNPEWAHDAAVFYSLEALGQIPRLHAPLFNAIHVDHLSTGNKAALDQWLAKNGVDPKKFDETMKSFGVQAKVRRAAQETIAYQVEGTPALAVQGLYTINGAPSMLSTTDYLIEQVRKARAAKK
jgi:thiol:disulfide interchange protein DsbA